jgi:hypothetical protein
MGPIALFDKSFLESLNPDEAVWFDHFFLANVCPIFYVETQSDLAKEGSSRGTPEELVRRIAYKFPDFSGSPNVHHTTMCTANLLGDEVPLGGHVILPRGFHAAVSDRQMAILPVSPEVKAFLRWAQGDYEEEERQAATVWRNSTTGYDTAEVISALNKIKVHHDGRCSGLADVRTASDEVMASLTPDQQVCLAMQLMGVNLINAPRILLRFKLAGEPPLSVFAPYVDFAMRIELFYHLAVHKSQMTPAHRMDLCYLYYLPFCQFFVSGDWVHKRCVPLFLRENQEFVAAEELKAALQSLNSHYLSLPESERNKSIHQIAPHPPKDGDNLVTKLWDRHFSGWRTARAAKVPRQGLKDVTAYWREKISQLQEIADTTGGDPLPTPIERLDALVLNRVARKRKGAWWRVPEELRRARPPKLSDHAFTFHDGVTADNVVDQEIEVYICRGEDTISSLPGCSTYLSNGQLWVDCAPSLNRRHIAPMPRGAILARAADSKRLAAFVSPESELGAMVVRLWEEERKRRHK